MTNLKTVKNSPLKGLLRKPFAYFKYLKNYKSIIEENVRYKNLHQGKRCFIIGNGPSLSKLDLKPLANEITISVNSFTISKEFEILKPKYHIMVDSTRFSKEAISLYENMKDLKNKSHKPVYVFPAKHREYILENNLQKRLEIMYLHSMPELKKISEIDFSKRIPPYQNVINVALYLAIFLGCTDIYLIGCDMTGIVKVYDENLNFTSGGHFYKEVSKKETEYIKELHENRTNEFMLKAYGYTFELFRLTNDYAQKSGINIYNATNGGTLDVFPWAKYEELFK